MHPRTHRKGGEDKLTANKETDKKVHADGVLPDPRAAGGLGAGGLRGGRGWGREHRLRDAGDGPPVAAHEKHSNSRTDLRTRYA